MRVICNVEKIGISRDCKKCSHIKQHTHNATCEFTCWNDLGCKCVSISEERLKKLKKLNEQF